MPPWPSLWQPSPASWHSPDPSQDRKPISDTSARVKTDSLEETCTLVFNDLRVSSIDAIRSWWSPVSAQFLHLQISTFDKSSIPTLAHSRMEIASLSFPLYSYPFTTLLSRRTRTRTRRHRLDIPEWFSGNHDKLLVLQ